MTGCNPPENTFLLPLIQHSNEPALRNPLYSYIHPAELLSCGGVVTGGAFYNPATNRFRAQDLGCYFFSDYFMGWIKRLEPSKGNAVSLFATEIPRPVDIKVGPDGNLYYLSTGVSGSVLKIEDATLPFSVVAATAPGNNAVILSWSWNLERVTRSN